MGTFTGGATTSWSKCTDTPKFKIGDKIQSSGMRKGIVIRINFDRTIRVHWDGCTYSSSVNWRPEQLKKVKEAKPMKQIRVTECTGHDCPYRGECLGKWHPATFERNWRFRVADNSSKCYAALPEKRTKDNYIREYELRDAPDSTPDREEVSEVLAMYQVIAWKRDGEKKTGLAYHQWLPAENGGNAKVKAMLDKVAWPVKNTGDPDDYIWQIIQQV